MKSINKEVMSNLNKNITMRKLLLLSMTCLISLTLKSQMVLPMDKIAIGRTFSRLTGKNALYLDNRKGIDISFSYSFDWETKNEKYHEIGFEYGFCNKGAEQLIEKFNNKFKVLEQYYGGIYYTNEVNFVDFKSKVGISPDSYKEPIGSMKINMIYFGLYYKKYFTRNWIFNPCFSVGYFGYLNFIPSSGSVLIETQRENTPKFNDVVSNEDGKSYSHDCMFSVGFDFAPGIAKRYAGIELRYYKGISSMWNNIDLEDNTLELRFTLYLKWYDD
jgi:hypothetical protein